MTTETRLKGLLVRREERKKKKSIGPDHVESPPGNQKEETGTWGGRSGSSRGASRKQVLQARSELTSEKAATMRTKALGRGSRVNKMTGIARSWELGFPPSKTRLGHGRKEWEP